MYRPNHRYLRALAFLLVPVLLLTLWASTSSAQGADGEVSLPSSSDDASTMETAPGESVVDYAPDADPNDPEVVAAVEAAAAVPVSTAPPAASVTADGDVTTSSVTVTFSSQYPSPPDVQNVIATAASDWADVLDISGPVEIEVEWFPFGNQQILGSAGFLSAYRGGPSLPADYFTPGPLANVLVNADIDPDNPEIQVRLNADFGSRWFIGTTGNPTGNQVDLYSVVLHELGHGFGFVGSASAPAGGSPALNDPPFGYDIFVYAGNGRLLDQPNPNSLLTSDNLFFDLPTGPRYKLYAPSNWAQGSSYSHFDEATYTGGDPGALMTPQLASTETQRSLDAPVIGVMEQIGWPLLSDPPGDTAAVGGAITSSAGSPVDNMVVDLFTATDPFTRGQWLGDASSNASGDYRFENLAAGCYILTFIAPQGGTFPANGSGYLNEYVCLAAGETNLGLDVAVTLAGGSSSVVGTVTNGGSGFDGLVIDLFATNGDGSRAAWLGDATTAGGGNYDFPVVPGCYVLVFIAPDGYNMDGGNRWLEATACVANAGDTVRVDAAVTPAP